MAVAVQKIANSVRCFCQACKNVSKLKAKPLPEDPKKERKTGKLKSQRNHSTCQLEWKRQRIVGSWETFWRVTWKGHVTPYAHIKCSHNLSSRINLNRVWVASKSQKANLHLKGPERDATTMLPSQRILESNVCVLCMFLVSHIFNLISQDKWRQTWAKQTETAPTPDLYPDVSFLICIVFAGSLDTSVRPPAVRQYATCAHLVCTSSNRLRSGPAPVSAGWSLSPVDKRAVAKLNLVSLQRKREKLNYFCLFRFGFCKIFLLKLQSQGTTGCIFYWVYKYFFGSTFNK